MRPAGNGQAVKGVNQLMMGLVDAAYLEAISFGVNSGVDVETISQAIGCEAAGAWTSARRRSASPPAKGPTSASSSASCPTSQRGAGGRFDLPIAATVYGYCDKGERVVIDDHRQALLLARTDAQGLMASRVRRHES